MFVPGEAGCFRQVAALYSDHYRQVPLYVKCLDQGRLAALDRWRHYTVTTIDRSTVHRMFGPGEAGCFRQVAALYSDHYRQVPLYIKCLYQGRLAALDRWLYYTVTTIDRFHCTSNVWTRGGWLF